jgi:hypothetical protein
VYLLGEPEAELGQRLLQVREVVWIELCERAPDPGRQPVEPAEVQDLLVEVVTFGQSAAGGGQRQRREPQQGGLLPVKQPTRRGRPTALVQALPHLGPSSPEQLELGAHHSRLPGLSAGFEPVGVHQAQLVPLRVRADGLQPHVVHQVAEPSLWLCEKPLSRSVIFTSTMPVRSMR